MFSVAANNAVGRSMWRWRTAIVGDLSGFVLPLRVAMLRLPPVC
jgi:hypothetical protein